MTILVNGYGNNVPSHRTCVPTLSENSLTRKSYVVFLRKLIINRAGVSRMFSKLLRLLFPVGKFQN